MIRPLLTGIQRRLAWQAFGRYAVRYALAAGGVFAGVMLLAPHNLLAWGIALLALTLLVAVVSAWIARPSLGEVARRLDALAATKDRLVTALAFSEGRRRAASPEWQQSALAECEAFLVKVDFRAHTPWKFPHEGRWLAVPVAVIAGISLFQQWPTLYPAPVRPPDATVVQKATELEKMAEKMEQSGREADKKIAEALKKAAEQLRAEATSESPEKAMLRELSALEQTLQEAREGNDAQNLAKAFEKAESLSRTAEALKKGEMASAADELEQAARKMREAVERMQAAEAGNASSPGTQGEQKNGEGRELSQLEKAMRAAAQKLGEKSPMGRNAQQAANAAQRREGEGMEQAMQQMAESIRRSQPGKGDSDKAQAQIDASIARLREMKSGQSGQQGEGEGPSMAQKQDGQGQGQQPGAGQDQQGQGDTPSGRPGSERDEGTKASPYGQQGEKAEASLASQLQGLLGEGESLHSLTPTHGGKDEAQRSYRALYEAAAPEAENALDRENIPIGSRLYIKRYFEAIRPGK